MVRYPLNTKLKDSSDITIRKMRPDDEEKSLEFFKSLPFEDRQYLRIDVTDPEILKKRMNPGPFYHYWRLVAERDNRIWGDATICSHATGWMRHAYEIRCIVHPDFKKKGLGSLLIWELFQKTLADKAEIVFCEAMPEQKGAVAVLEKLGFKKTLVRPNHVKDIKGDKHDLYIYTKDVNAMWDTLKSYMDGYDFDISTRH